ncbi:hypothetical protein JAAARDRAFT_33017 [Jaapia argillacea MUCL 33604]|uniref:Exonuclease domain-containing protein n=1 Tax=Jaapia argillacea MUCL 33604 TaxID=933084 RepID=A0A067QA60_9AGAM|nr:hypothetical protein JAAARDRAFT_33017 [Jaapia argillacea MUCL 33604]
MFYSRIMSSLLDLSSSWTARSVVVLAVIGALVINRRPRKSLSVDDKSANPLTPTSSIFGVLLSPVGRGHSSEDTSIPADPKPLQVATEEVGGKETAVVKVKQPYDALLVLDVEGTCMSGTTFDYPNEIIEWPVCLMRWKDKDEEGKASQLEIVAEFRSFVKPTWRPTLSQFCTQLTGITQEQVDTAPTFSEVMKMFSEFLSANGLVHPGTGKRLERFCWCSDGPFDVRDFVVKQCFISKMTMPSWITGDIMDVRKIVSNLSYGRERDRRKTSTFTRRISLNIPAQLKFLGLPPFEGRQHSGIDDTRNIARIISELGRRGVRLEPNYVIHPRRRWQWMGKPGEILEEYIT